MFSRLRSTPRKPRGIQRRRNIWSPATLSPICFMKHMGFRASGLAAMRYAR